MEDRPQPDESPPESNLQSVATELLLNRHRRGESRAMDKLFFRIRERLLAAIRTHPSHPFLPPTHNAEDVLQDLWVALFARGSLDRFEDQGRGSLRAYLRRCLDFLMADICRKASAAKRGGDHPPRSLNEGQTPGEGSPQPVAGGAGPATAAAWGDWQERCLQILTGQDRDVWRLRFVVTFDYKAIADRLEISEAAARSAYHRAIGKLHQSGILILEESV